ncbi:MAG: Nif3-like dinuclear metal center hexameric protein [Oscillospiraceae bacterium]|nr:Nif3-like dinuclear metal center hexameric protein [Oscillospiraceae bacterium]
MTTTGEIYDYIDSFAPFASAMDFDNPGLLVGERTTSLQRILFALDITPDVVREGNKLAAQLIVSHHPVIFNPLKQLKKNSAPYLLAQYGIDAICAHTNLDMAAGGVNTALAACLQLQHVHTLAEYQPELPEALMGDLTAALEPQAFAKQVKKQLACDGLRYTNGKRKVKTVGLCSGGGADLLYAAVDAGCEGFVTGESKHNLLLDAEQLQLTLVDAGHYATEVIVLDPLMKRISAQFPAVRCIKSQTMHSPAAYL